MSDEIDIILGSGNNFRDFGHANAELEQLRAVLAAAIIATLDETAMTVRAAETATGVAAADFSRIRRAKLERFTIDRLMMILSRLGQRLDVQVRRVEAA